MIELVLRFSAFFFTRWIKNISSLICLGVVILWLLPWFEAADFEPLLYIILILVALVLAVVLSIVVSKIRDAIIIIISLLSFNELAVKHPELAKLEKKRGLIVGGRLIYFAVALVLIILVATTLGFVVTFFFFLLMYGIYALIFRATEELIQDLFKQVVVFKQLDAAFTEVKFEQYNRFSLDEINNLRLFSNFNTISGNDLLDAKRGGRHFRRCDLLMQNEHEFTDANGNTSTVTKTVFSGSAFHFELLEPSPVRLLAATEGFSNLREADGALKKLVGLAGNNSVETEMDEFNRMFDVYCSDQTAARVLLTPQMIEGIYRVGKLSKYELAMLFEENNLYLFLSTPGIDSFEASSSSVKSLKTQHETVAKQVELIAAIVDNMYFRGTVS